MNISRVRIEHSDAEEKWFVVEERVGEEETDKYLHQDGVWRTSTLHKGEYTGYFSSLIVAARTLEQALFDGDPT